MAWCSPHRVGAPTMRPGTALVEEGIRDLDCLRQQTAGVVPQVQHDALTTTVSTVTAGVCAVSGTALTTTITTITTTLTRGRGGTG